MKDNKLFTIIIPTYNRSSLLAASLNRILPVAKGYEDYVSVFISDNCSTDDTEFIVSEFKSQYGSLIGYHRQLYNVGPDNNYRDAVSRVKSRFVALISDDDYVLPFYIPKILELLSKYTDVCLINVNMICSNSSYTSFAGLRDSIAAENDLVYYSDGLKFIAEHLEVPSLISSNVFEREYFLDNINIIKTGTYPGYDWLAILYRGILNKPCIYYDLPLIVQLEPDQQRWESEKAWYYVNGFGRLFKDLSVYNKDIFINWQARFVQRLSLGFFIRINTFKVVYRERYKIMKPFMPNRYSAFMLFLSIYTNKVLIYLTYYIHKVVIKLKI